ncbi:AHH domain-containing protein [Thalassomonas actiniarum]|uniref:AHH domain-containing protein n=1 Tax=Thalassomonas actiniarum TaxID=485447 RepID=A0AAE9YM88_9GAMM|nr:AHH domain-containing protein [Thalassomonas actiniarum]WDD97546.1 AHH domain-containing protein [Thalassomonas actiniarum]
MTQIGEGVAVGATQQSQDEDCWYCKEPPKKEQKKNSITADPDTSQAEVEDQVEENDITNDASALGENLGARPVWHILCPDKEIPTAIIPGAHHCIPGNAAFKHAMKDGLVDFVSEGGDFNLTSDIGYSINHANNGVWLPGNYGVRPKKGHYTKKWSSYPTAFKNEYAKRAIKATGRQFHDAHPNYNKQVKKTLYKIMEKMGEPDKNCPICGKEFDSTRPPFGLVRRLDFVSASYKRVLENLSIKTGRKVQHINGGTRTSNRVITYFKK